MQGNTPMQMSGSNAQGNSTMATSVGQATTGASFITTSSYVPQQQQQQQQGNTGSSQPTQAQQYSAMQYSGLASYPPMFASPQLQSSPVHFMQQPQQYTMTTQQGYMQPGGMNTTSYTMQPQSHPQSMQSFSAYTMMPTAATHGHGGLRFPQPTYPPTMAFQGGAGGFQSGAVGYDASMVMLQQQHQQQMHAMQYQHQAQQMHMTTYSHQPHSMPPIPPQPLFSERSSDDSRGDSVSASLPLPGYSAKKDPSQARSPHLAPNRNVMVTRPAPAKVTPPRVVHSDRSDDHATDSAGESYDEDDPEDDEDASDGEAAGGAGGKKSAARRKSGQGSKVRRKPRSETGSVPADQQSIIICGIEGGPNGERIYMEDDGYFDAPVDVYQALDDPQKRTLYRASALAHKFHCATNQVGMYLVRRRHQHYVSGLYQATAFQSKPAGRTGLKAGGYFVSRSLCDEFESYMAQHAKHTRHRNKVSARARDREAAAIAAAVSATSTAATPTQVSASPDSETSKSTPAKGMTHKEKAQAREQAMLAAAALRSGVSGGSQQGEGQEPASPASSGLDAMSEAANEGAVRQDAAPASRSSPKLNQTTSAHIQSSAANAPAFLLHEFAATVSMQSGATMQSAVSPPSSSTTVPVMKKRKSMTVAATGLTRGTPESQTRGLATATEQLSVSSDRAPGFNRVTSNDHLMNRRESSSMSGVRALVMDDDLADAYATTSAASSTANSQPATPSHITQSIRAKTALTQMRPKVQCGGPPSLPPSSSQSANSSPYVSVYTLPSAPSSPGSFSLSSSPLPQSSAADARETGQRSPTSPSTVSGAGGAGNTSPRATGASPATKRILPASTYVKLLLAKDHRGSASAEGGSAGGPSGSTVVQNILRNLSSTDSPQSAPAVSDPSSGASFEPSSKRQQLYKSHDNTPVTSMEMPQGAPSGLGDMSLASLEGRGLSTSQAMEQ